MMDKFDSWADFVRASARLNSFYNGIIFKQHFIDSPDFKPDEKVFADICGELSDKRFAVLFRQYSRSHSRQCLRTISRQGHRRHRQTRHRSGKARSPQSGRRLLHARIYRALHRRKHHRQTNQNQARSSNFSWRGKRSEAA